MISDQVFNLLEKVYFEVQEVKSELKQTKEEVQRNRYHIIRLENEVKVKFSAMSDDITGIKDEIKEKIGRNEKKLDDHELRIRAIEVGQ